MFEFLSLPLILLFSLVFSTAWAGVTVVRRIHRHRHHPEEAAEDKPLVVFIKSFAQDFFIFVIAFLYYKYRFDIMSTFHLAIGDNALSSILNILITITLLGLVTGGYLLIGKVILKLFHHPFLKRPTISSNKDTEP